MLGSFSKESSKKMEKAVAVVIFLQALLTFIEASSMYSVDTREIANIGGRRYYFSNVPLNVPESITLCQELNMTLAGLETPDEYNAVTDYMINTLGRVDAHWTSGSLHFKSWVWSNSGELFAFFKWDSDEPDPTDGRTQQNVFLLNGFMREYWSESEYKCICEEKPSCISN